jgi:hypothetical protein
MWHHLWREDGSVFYNCCWCSPAQSFSGPRPAGLMTTFYYLRFETPPTRGTGPCIYILRGQGGPVLPPRHWVPFSSPPTTRRAMVEVFEPASTRVSTGQLNCLQDNSSTRTTSKTLLFYYRLRVRFRGNVFTDLLLRNGLYNPVVLSLCACMLLSLPSNDRCLQSHRLATDVYTTILRWKIRNVGAHTRCAKLVQWPSSYCNIF